MGVNKARRAIVQKLNHIVRQCGVPAVSDTAGQKIVEAMYRAIAAKLPSGSALTTAATAAFDEYTASFAKVAVQPGQAHVAQEWHFKAARFTYNATVGEWVSKDHATLEALFTRLVVFFQSLISSVHILGFSATLEESLQTGDHVHAHVYLHLGKAFHRKGRTALDPFVFEGIKPHIEVNKANGGAWTGAVAHGHFYVFVDKKGSLFTWSNFEPFKNYKVESWWLVNLLKAEKIDRDIYLACRRFIVNYVCFHAGLAKRIAPSVPPFLRPSPQENMQIQQ